MSAEDASSICEQPSSSAVKRCSKCGNDKPLIDFSRSVKSKDGFTSQCKSCVNAAYVQNREKRLAKAKEYRQARSVERKAEIAEYNRQYRQANKEKLTQAHTAWRYGLSPEAYRRLLDSQGGTCALCDSSDNLCVDHDHNCCPNIKSCGRCVRGILCSRHNKALGFFKDSKLEIEKALKYVVAAGRVSP